MYFLFNSFEKFPIAMHNYHNLRSKSYSTSNISSYTRTKSEQSRLSRTLSIDEAIAELKASLLHCSPPHKHNENNMYLLFRFLIQLYIFIFIVLVRFSSFHFSCCLLKKFYFSFCFDFLFTDLKITY